MLGSLNALIGLPVIWQDRKLGCVERAIADVQGGCLDGLVVRKGIGVARWIGRDDVHVLGRNCVLVQRLPDRMPEKKAGEMGRVFLTTGECAGEVTDIWIDMRTLRIAALEVCQGPLCRLLGRRGYADSFRLQSNGEEDEVIVPQLFSWMQLKMQLGEGDDG